MLGLPDMYVSAIGAEDYHRVEGKWKEECRKGCKISVYLLPGAGVAGAAGVAPGAAGVTGAAPGATGVIDGAAPAAPGAMF